MDFIIIPKEIIEDVVTKTEEVLMLTTENKVQTAILQGADPAQLTVSSLYKAALTTHFAKKGMSSFCESNILRTRQ
jgi:hypothetical protein